MIRRLLLALIGGTGLGYGIAMYRYGNTESIKQLKDDHRDLKSTHESLQDKYTQLRASQELIKARAKELVAENQDYASIVSQLNRYYYQLQDTREIITTLQEKLGPKDQVFQKKLESMASRSLSTDSGESNTPQTLKR